MGLFVYLTKGYIVWYTMDVRTLQGAGMKLMNDLLARHAVDSGFVRITLHCLVFVFRKQSWQRTKAGITREFCR